MKDELTKTLQDYALRCIAKYLDPDDGNAKLTEIPIRHFYDERLDAIAKGNCVVTISIYADNLREISKGVRREF